MIWVAVKLGYISRRLYCRWYNSSGLLSGPFQMFENISSTLSPRWKKVLVLVGKWCGTSWGAVSFSWVVFVRPFKGSPPVAIGTRKSINVGGRGGGLKNMRPGILFSPSVSHQKNRASQRKKPMIYQALKDILMWYMALTRCADLCSTAQISLPPWPPLLFTSFLCMLSWRLQRHSHIDQMVSSQLQPSLLKSGLHVVMWCLSTGCHPFLCCNG